MFNEDGCDDARVFSIIVEDTEEDLRVWDFEPGVDDFGGLVVEELSSVCKVDAREASVGDWGELG